MTDLTTDPKTKPITTLWPDWPPSRPHDWHHKWHHISINIKKEEALRAVNNVYACSGTRDIQDTGCKEDNGGGWLDQNMEEGGTWAEYGRKPNPLENHMDRSNVCSHEKCQQYLSLKYDACSFIFLFWKSKTLYFWRLWRSLEEIPPW